MKNKKRMYKVSIYPEPYILAVEAIDKITAKQEAVNMLSIRVRDIYKIIATTQAERKLRGAGNIQEKLSTKRMIKNGYL